MNPRTLAQLRGARQLFEEAVEHGSRAVERVHRATADRTFVVLEAIPPVEDAARVVHRVHDVVLGGVYGSVRGVNRVVGSVLTVVLAEVATKAER